MTPAYARREARTAWLFVTPALVLLGVFFAVPVLTGFLLSFTDYDIYAIGDPSVMRVVGLRNYTAMLESKEFWHAVRVTMIYVVFGGALSVAASLGAALLLHAKAVRLRGVFRSIFFTPYVTTLVAVAIVWRYLYHPEYGLIDATLAALHLPKIDWLGDPHWAMPSIIVMSTWKNFGYNMLIFVAGLLNIPDEQYEAARLDGAGPWAQFRYVTLPALAPTFFFVGVLTMVGNFQLFSEPYVMTQGGPLRSTVSVVLLMYEEGFRWWRLGNATAIAFLLFAFMLVGTWIQSRVAKAQDA